MAEDTQETGELEESEGPQSFFFKSELPERFLSIQPAALSSPVVSLRRIRTITTYEVMETDLEDLDRATSAEAQALAFACLCLGALVSTVVSWLGAGTLSAPAIATYTAATMVLVLASGNFLFSWRREHKKRKALLDRVRSQTVVTEEEQVA